MLDKLIKCFKVNKISNIKFNRWCLLINKITIIEIHINNTK